MKRIISRSLGGIVLIMLVLFGWLSWRSYGRQAMPASMIAPAVPMQIAVNVPVEKVNQQESPLPTVTPTPIPTLAVWVTPELPPIDWSEPPPCQNQPRAVVEWQNKVRDEKETAKEKTRLSFKRAQRLSPSLQTQGDADQLIASFLEEAGADEKKGFSQDKLGLWLNIVSGYINRETEIAIADLPEIKTVKELTQRLEQTTDDPATLKKLRKAIDGVLKGKAITNPVCANLFIMQFGKDLESQLWKGNGITKANYDVEKQITQDGWVPGLFQISPNYQKLAIESYSYEGGGPVYLYDLVTHTLINLNLTLNANIHGENNEGLTPFQQNEKWRMLGWHPDSQRLLLGVQDQTSVFWVNLQQMTYERINLSTPKTFVDTSDEFVALLPDGTGFLYVSREEDEQGYAHIKDKLTLVDLSTQTTQVILEWTDQHGRISYPRISPTGEYVAFVVESGTNAADMTYSLQLFSFQTRQVTELVASDHLGRTIPVWSPDGKLLAFPWSVPEARGFYPVFPELAGWLGNLWVVSVETGQLQQVTDLRGAARRPAWSLDGETLTFFTHNGQFGATSLKDGKSIWPVTEGSLGTLHYGSLIYLP